ncbi:MAG: hypothetical protein K2Y09_08095 [Nitrosomonas sp.]|uniref:hypothetical protein n=1 Tax=Nitrosomonas sp. TaxID=42353 RepID=UPI001E038144|nr:hypothetical protein [Nitrosomonas sp.]MBX9895125.1 hypothetical protein [Nitrosomonas sp.]
MDDIKNQFSEVKNKWAVVYAAALSNPQLWKPHLPNTSLEMLNEVVETVSIWLERSKAPNGFSPGYHLAKSLAAIYLPSLLSTVQQLEAGNYSHLQNFVNYLINTLAVIHTAVVYAPKNHQESINANFTAELSQALSLMNTAQRELSKKIELLDKSSILVEEIEESHGTVKNAEKEIETCKDKVTEIQEQTNKYLNNAAVEFEKIKQIRSEYIQVVENNKSEFEAQLNKHRINHDDQFTNFDREYRKLLGDCAELDNQLKVMINQLSELQEKCVEQEKIIDSILPRGASAGLAAAFSERGKQLERSKWIWLTAFAFSILLLSGFALYLLVGMAVPEETTFWNQLMLRLPLAAPMVWLGWFSAIQYGNVIRVQEDYAFKEATSKAFQGYRDHMEHLRNVDLDEGKTALTLLSEVTINVLSREPLRIYGKTEQDASPTHGFMNFWRRGDQRSTSETTRNNASK